MKMTTKVAMAVNESPQCSVGTEASCSEVREVYFEVDLPEVARSVLAADGLRRALRKDLEESCGSRVSDQVMQVLVAAVVAVGSAVAVLESVVVVLGSGG